MACVACKMKRSRTSRQPVPEGDRAELTVWGRVHADVCEVGFGDGEKNYILVLVDCKSRMKFVWPCKKKGDVKEGLKEFAVKYGLGGGRTLLYVDGGREFIGTFRTVAAVLGFRMVVGPPYTPQLNGLVERENAELAAMMSTCLHHAFPDGRGGVCATGKGLWAECAKYCEHVRNCKKLRSLGDRCPYEVALGEREAKELVEVKRPGFGELCHVYLEKIQRGPGKLARRSRPAYFVGWDSNGKAFRVAPVSSNKVLRIWTSRTVNFEDTLVKKYWQCDEVRKMREEQQARAEVTETKVEEASRMFSFKEDKVEELPESENDVNKNEASNTVPELPVKEPTEEVPKPKRKRGRPPKNKPTDSPAKNKRKGRPAKEPPAKKMKPKSNKRKIEEVAAVAVSWKQAREDVRWEEYVAAAHGELERLKGYNAFQETTYDKVPHGSKVVGSMCLFTLKEVDGEKGRKDPKARIVILGNQEDKNGLKELRASVVQTMSIRVMLARAMSMWNKDNLTVLQLDVTAAFLQSDQAESNEEPLYVAPPKELTTMCNLVERGTVWRVQSAMYGQRSAPRKWQRTVARWLDGFGDVRRCIRDENVYIKYNDSRQVTALFATFVDDVIMMGEQESCEEIAGRFCERFDCKEAKPVSTYVGVEYTIKKEGIFMTQQEKIVEMARRHGLCDANPVWSPTEHGDTLEVFDGREDKELDPKIEPKYGSLIGELLYIACATRPEICWAVTQLSRSIKKPCERTWKAAKRVAKYLHTTKYHGIRMPWVVSEENKGIWCWTDANWCTPRSTSMALTYCDGRLVAWQCRRQVAVALSSCEAELAAASMGGRLLRSIQVLWEEIMNKSELKITLVNDNSAAVQIGNDESNKRRIRHVMLSELAIVYWRETFGWTLKHIPGSGNKADIGTKSLGPQKFAEMVKLIGICSKN